MRLGVEREWENKSGNREMKLSYKTCERDGLKDRMELMI